ncbi:uncharacterized protein LOC142632571 [Castanea sativa]|uniref:uncharacterized protein LOC142632571 n=1 Tax=Castanea sativa TaxID=21020 RepID=UPI003F65424D
MREGETLKIYFDRYWEMFNEIDEDFDDVAIRTFKVGLLAEHDLRKSLTKKPGSGAEIMYPDLYNGLNLKLEDLTTYDSPLISFDGKAIVPKGQIRLLVQLGSEVVEVDFIVVDAYSPYTAIIARPWLHALGVVSSTLHLKVKFLSGDQIEELLGSQSVAKQCMAVAILHQPEVESSPSAEGGS